MELFSKLFKRRKTSDTLGSSAEDMANTHEAIQLARKGEISTAEMLERLVNGWLFVPLAGPPQMAGNAIERWKPATVSKGDGSQWLVAFTDTELASEFAKHNSSYEHGLRTQTDWVLQALPEEHGLVFNLGSSDMFEWNAKGVKHYKAEVLSSDPS